MVQFIQENNRDYRPEFDVEIAGMGNLDKFDLSIHIKSKVRICPTWIIYGP